MWNKLFTIISTVACIIGLVGLICYFINDLSRVRQRTKPVQQTVHLAGATPDIVENSGMQVETAPSATTLEKTQPDPATPRVVRVISDEENIASLQYYVEPKEKSNLFVIPNRLLKPGEVPPNLPKESIIFGSIDPFAQNLRWPPLRDVGVPEGSLEVRIWMLESFMSVKRLVRHDGEWMCFQANEYDQIIKIIQYEETHKVTEEIFNELKSTVPIPIFQVIPRTNWARIWDKLESLGILILPDVPFKPGLDGCSYVVEINDGGRYRTYTYCNPDSQEEPETKKMLEIINTLNSEL